MSAGPARARHPRGHRAYRRLRAQVLIEELVCRMCRRVGRTTAATVVDHIIPLKRRPDLLLVRKNLQALCGECHRKKTAREHLQLVGSSPLRGRRKNRHRKRYHPIDIHGEVVV